MVWKKSSAWSMSRWAARKGSVRATWVRWVPTQRPTGRFGLRDFGASVSCPLTEHTHKENPSPELRASGPGTAAEARGRALPADSRRSPRSALSGAGTALGVGRVTDQRRAYGTSTEMGSSAPARGPEQGVCSHRSLRRDSQAGPR